MGRLKESLENILLFTEVSDASMKDNGIVILVFLKGGVHLSVIKQIFQMNYSSNSIRKMIDFRERQIKITKIIPRFFQVWG